MRIIKEKINIDFLKYRKPAALISVLLVLASVISLGIQQLNWGLDFTGGTLLEVRYQEAADVNSIRGQLEGAGIGGAVVQQFGADTDIIIRIPELKLLEDPQNLTIVEQCLFRNADAALLADVEALRGSATNDKVGACIFDTLKAAAPSVDQRRLDYVGPAVGEELSEDGGLAMLVALICIMAYVALRFEWKFAVGSVAALAHDVLITLGFFSLTRIEFDLTVLAALLAVIGYSLNDTIVVFDRIRENFLKMRKGTSEQVINNSLNQTLARTIVTSLTTLLVLVALFYFGGSLIHAFAIALIVGILIGTYSSIYVASNVALALGVKKEDLMPPEVEKEGADQDPLMP